MTPLNFQSVSIFIRRENRLSISTVWFAWYGAKTSETNWHFRWTFHFQTIAFAHWTSHRAAHLQFLPTSGALYWRRIAHLTAGDVWYDSRSDKNYSRVGSSYNIGDLFWCSSNDWKDSFCYFTSIPSSNTRNRKIYKPGGKRTSGTGRIWYFLCYLYHRNFVFRMADYSSFEAN